MDTLIVLLSVVAYITVGTFAYRVTYLGNAHRCEDDQLGLAAFTAFFWPIGAPVWGAYLLANHVCREK